jgi:hypothetical protein
VQWIGQRLHKNVESVENKVEDVDVVVLVVAVVLAAAVVLQHV